MRILYFGDGPWASKGLERLVYQGQSVAGVVLRRHPSDLTLEETARRLAIDVLQPEKVNATDFISTVAGLGPELCISMSYDQILRKALLELPELGFVNFHAGKLPYYRGRNVINWAIINNETSIGLTAHYLDQGIDTGDIILQRTLPIEWEDTYGDVLDRVTDAFPDLIADTVGLIESGCAPRQPQAHLSGTYFCARRDGDEWIDWSSTSLEIYNKIRAIAHPAPGAKTLLDGQPLTIWRATYDPSWPAYVATPGQVVGRDAGKGVVVKTGDATIVVNVVQAYDGAETLASFPIGTRFGINVAEELYRLKRDIKDLESRLGAEH